VVTVKAKYLYLKAAAGGPFESKLLLGAPFESEVLKHYNCCWRPL